MAETPLARDRLVFAPTPLRVVFVIDGTRVETALYNFLDLPAKHALEVYHLEDEMRGAGEDFGKLLEASRAIVRRLCPELEAAALEALVPSQMQAAISASHGVGPSRAAGVDVASPSASADSITGSPAASAGPSPSSSG